MRYQSQADGSAGESTPRHRTVRHRYVTVDYDFTDHTDLENVIFLLRLKHVCSVYECRIARTHKGLHVYIKINDYDFWRAIVLRTYLFDDPCRIEIDIIRWYSGLRHWVETLFIAKKDIGYEYVEEETSLEELTRSML